MRRLEGAPGAHPAVLILGGIYSGAMTPTEAAAVAVIYALPVGFFVYRGLNLRNAFGCTKDSAVSVGSIMIMIFCSMMLSQTYVVLQIPQAIVESVFSITDNSFLILLLINLILLFVGMIVNDTTGIILVAPLLLPLAKAIGLDPIQYAAIFGVNLAVGSLTPPYASLLYLGIRIGKVDFVEILPYVGLFLLGYVPVMLLTTYWPDVSLFIPLPVRFHLAGRGNRHLSRTRPPVPRRRPLSPRRRGQRAPKPFTTESIMKKVMSVLALCGLLALSGGSAFAAQWKLAHIRPADSVIERDLQAFAKEVREATDGRIDIRIYGSSQLGDYTVVQEKVSLGSVEMSCESVSTQVDKRFLSYILPYVAKDYATAKKNFGTGTPYAKYCANLFDKQDIMVLANWPVYFGGIGLVKAPEAPADPNASHHIKVRVPTMKTQEALADGLGYQATPLPFAEFFTAAQTGMVSGIFGGGAENYYASFRDLLKCYIAANTHFENWPLLINKELFESLSAEDQKILLEKSAAFEARRWEVAEADQAAYEKKLEEAGWTVIRLTPEQQNAFAEKGRKASWPELKKAIGDKAYEEVISTFVLE